jgi:hypothetical protein
MVVRQVRNRVDDASFIVLLQVVQSLERGMMSGGNEFFICLGELV